MLLLYVYLVWISYFCLITNYLVHHDLASNIVLIASLLSWWGDIAGPDWSRRRGRLFTVLRRFHACILLSLWLPPSPLLSCPPLSDEADVVKNILFVPDMTDENHQQTSARRRSDFMWKTAGFGWKCFQMSLKKISSDVTPTPVVCLASFLICNNTITSTSPCERQLIII